MKTLFDYNASTCVADEAKPAGSNGSWKAPVYLASVQGYENYCKDCPRLLEKSEVESNFWRYRVVCSVAKCEKP